MNVIRDTPASARGRVTVAAAIVMAVLLSTGFGALGQTSESESPVRIKVTIRGARQEVRVERDQSGALVYVLTLNDGREERLSPTEFTERLYEDQSDRGWLSILLNISSPIGMIWVGLGLLGQLLFTGRMVVQWLVSEKARRSVVPVAFWWMSLLGAFMLLTYFVWRRDIIGVLGQSTGFLIYGRNLYLIYFTSRRVAVTADPGAGPELAPTLAPNDAERR